MISITLKLTSEDIGQIAEDLSYVNSRIGQDGKEVLLPFTRGLLREIIRKAGKEASRMVKTGSEFSEACGEAASLLAQPGPSGGCDGTK
jgi:hypothetical protein